MKRIFLIMLLFLLIMPAVFAREGRMSLLAVKEATNEGSAADLFLEIKSGKGRVFLETIPLSKFDTQISTRFAKDMACDYLDKDCSKYDFFYTIKAQSPIIGGPSAGGAIAVLTAAVLADVEVDEAVAITGTINSGGIIGPVGGLQAKIEAASEMNINTVLIPKGERFLKEINLTIDLADYGKKFGIAVVEVGDLTEALYHFTGKKFKGNIPELEINPAYENTMKKLAEELCARKDDLQKEIVEFELVEFGIVDDEFVDTEEVALNLSVKGSEAFKEKRYYSAASYCFGASVRYRGLLLRLNRYKDFDAVLKEIEDFDEKLNKIKIETVTDLQAYMVVKERLKDAADSIEKAREMDNYEAEFGYAIERIYSAESWSNFFGVDGKEFNFDKISLEQSCVNKLSEAEERYQYAMLYFPTTLKGTRIELDHAYKDYEGGDFALCLFKASKAKAEADIVLGTVGVGEDQIDSIIESKLEAVKRVIAEQQEKDIFPILGYSYYEYGDYLKEDNPVGALLYAEYALELSNINIYFESKRFDFVEVLNEEMLLFIAGIILGVVAVLLLKDRLKSKKSVFKRKKKR